MKNHRKINYYKLDVLEGGYRYIASSNAWPTLTEASYHLPQQDQQGNLVYRPRVFDPPSIRYTNTLNLWRIGYADSSRWFDGALLANKRRTKHS